MREFETNIGAISALKGYRVQFLYSLYRILFSINQDESFYPEGKYEDFDVYDSEGRVIELNQIKHLKKRLTLSDLISSKPTSFIRRVLRAHTEKASPQIKLISFGEVGDEIVELGKENFSKSLQEKLKRHGIKEHEIGILQKYFSYEIVNESDLTNEIITKLTTLKIFANVQSSLELLVYWMYVTAEKQLRMEPKSFQEQLMAVSRFQIEQVNFNNSFGTLIKQLGGGIEVENVELIKQEFYKGISTNYRHILAGVDVVREDKLAQLHTKFSESNIVFIHGASGQGKSTLAYRYLHEFSCSTTAYTVVLPKDTRQVYEVINSLENIAKGIKFPITLYIDVVPGAREWIDVLQALSSKKLFKFLVTLREEDWNAVSIDDKFIFEDLELIFNEDEASEIYASLNAYRVDLRFTDFKEAWSLFGEKGPLLEFVYLVTQGQALLDKIKSQINVIQDESTELAKDKIKLLRYTSLADCFHARVGYTEIATHLNLPNIGRLVELLEKEYLLRVSEDQRLIVGVHPIRSEIIFKTLFDGQLESEVECILDSLSFIENDTLLDYLRHAFKRTSLKPAVLIERVKGIEFGTFLSYYSIFKALLWRGIQDYAETNKKVLDEVYDLYGEAWITIVNMDLAGVIEMGGLAESLEIFSKEKQLYAKEVNQQLTEKTGIYDYCKDWLDSLNKINIAGSSEEDLFGLGRFVFWLDHLNCRGIDISFETILSKVDLNNISPLVLAQLLGSFRKYNDLSRICVEAIEKVFLRKLFTSHNLISLDIKDGIAASKYFLDIIGWTKEADGENDFMHSSSMRIIELLRVAYPEMEYYGTRAYGHKLSFLTDEYDSSKKHIPKKLLPLRELTEINAIFINLFTLRFRPTSWKDYVDGIIKKRKFLLEALTKQIHSFAEFHKRKNFSPLVDFVTDFANKYESEIRGESIGLFPKVILDEWGTLSENNRKQKNKGDRPNQLEKRLAISLQKYEGFRYSYREFDSSIRNYLSQSTEVILNRIKVSLKKDVTNLGDLPRISLVGNLYTAAKILESFQNTFRDHFEKFVDEELLTEIERKEVEAVLSLTFIYRHFIYSEGFLSGNVVKNSLIHVAETKEKFEQKLRKTFQNLGRSINSSFRFEFDIELKKCIIFAEVPSPMEALTKLEEIYNSLQVAINKPEYTSIKYLIIDTHYQSFNIIFLVKGKSLSGTWFEFNVFNLIGKQFSEAKLNHIPKEIPAKIILKYKVLTWNKHLKELESLDSLLRNVGMCYQIGFHFVQFYEFKDVSIGGEGEVILQNYLKKVAETFQVNLQEGLDLFGLYISKCNDGYFEFGDENEKYQFFQLMLETHKYFYPTDPTDQNDGEGKEVSTLEMEAWVPRLEKLTGNVGVIHSFLAGKIISEQHST
jgi:hypothetical protein